ncbi:40S ribosomal protein S2 [Tupaia chinensis]|uniref:40S ribosomal protein S2 n=1 Tax=Tupaia chinensis TaxID=246437 RepID=L9JH14_TUPCH|nr:40S ribosomal protein S2 [Tupaia chinensis]
MLVYLIPTPKGTDNILGPVPKKLLLLASTDDCYTSARLYCMHLLGNYTKVLLP